MAYTCPDCLRTSHHPEDEKNTYCGNCHEFKQSNVHDELSPFQLTAAKSLQGTDPTYYLMKAVTQYFLKGQAGWDGILLELLPFYNATRLSKEQWDALNFVTKRTAEMTKVVPPSE